MNPPRECYSCAAREADGAVFAPRPRRAPLICTDCLAEASRPLIFPPKPIRRGRYRAALRYRQSLPQLDLVDLLVVAP